MAQIKTIDTVAGENQIDFKRRYPFVWLKNLGDTDVYISDKAGIVAEADGVVLLGAGQAAMLENYDDCVYVLGATTIEAHGQHSADSPFGDTIVAGGGGGGPAPVLIEKTITQNGVYDPEDDNADGYSMIDVEVPVVDVIELNANMNRTYTAPAGKAYSPVNVSVPGPSISKLTVAHNNVTYEAGIGAAFNPVEVSIPMDTLNAPSNGVYQIDENTQDGWDTVLVDTYEKYNVLFFSNATGAGYEAFTDEVTTSKYDELWMTGYYSYVDGEGSHIALWNSRFPTSAVYEFASRKFGVLGSDNYLWCTPDIQGRGITTTDMYGYDYPYMYIGMKNRDSEQDLLWKNSETTTPSSITLSDSIFDYDEICLQFVYIANETFSTTMWFLTSDLSINDTIYGYNYSDGEISKYTISANDTLTVVSESGFRLYAVYGVKDNSMTETTLFTNPSDSTMPATITLSDAYTNYDELVIIGHPVSDTIKGTQYYPVKALGKMLYNSTYDRVGIFTDVTNCWMEITSTTTLVPDTTSGMIVDKIIGIKRPVVSTAHELIDVVPLTANSNGTYTAPTGTAYSPVVVDVQEAPWEPLEDGYSNFWFELTDDTLSPWLNFSAKNADAVIDWGDGSGEVALDTLTPTHTYAKAGKYVVKVKGVTGIVAQRYYDSSRAGYYMYNLVLKAIEINNEISSIGQEGFWYAYALENIAFSNTSTTLGNASFQDCLVLRKVTFISSSIPVGICKRCSSLTEAVIPNATTINSEAFMICSLLRKVTIGSNITSLGNNAFYLCYSLNEIHIQATTPPTLGSSVFVLLPSNWICYVPAGTGETYKAAAGWSAYSDHILEEGQTVIKAMQRKFEANTLKGDESSDKR